MLDFLHALAQGLGVALLVALLIVVLFALQLLAGHAGEQIKRHDREHRR